MHTDVEPKHPMLSELSGSYFTVIHSGGFHRRIMAISLCKLHYFIDENELQTKQKAIYDDENHDGIY